MDLGSLPFVPLTFTVTAQTTEDSILSSWSLHINHISLFVLPPPFLVPFISGDTAVSLVTWGRVRAWTLFCPQVQPFLAIVASQRLQIVPAVFVYNIKPQILRCFGRQHGMCAGCVCVPLRVCLRAWLYTEVKQRGRAGAIVSAEVEGWNCFVFAVRKYDLRASCQLP